MLDVNYFMEMAIELAKLGGRDVRPNPLVGAVIFDDSGNILGKGYHRKFGHNHAEVKAINDAISNGFDIRGANMCVTLEPCCHFGKTPPCTDAIISAGIKKVAISKIDPNPIVSGKGIARLQNAGISVSIGHLEEQYSKINRYFEINKSISRPYLNLKIATTIDGKVHDSHWDSRWITGSRSREYVHQNIRSDADAILTSAKTVLFDNPRLNVRTANKHEERTIIVLDRDLLLMERKDLKIFENNQCNIIFLTNIEKDPIGNLLFLQCPVSANGRLDISNALKTIYTKYGICKISTECGGKLLSYLLEKDLYDELNLFISPKLSLSRTAGWAEFSGDNPIKFWKEIKLDFQLNLDGDILLNYKR